MGIFFASSAERANARRKVRLRNKLFEQLKTKYLENGQPLEEAIAMLRSGLRAAWRGANRSAAVYPARARINVLFAAAPASSQKVQPAGPPIMR